MMWRVLVVDDNDVNLKLLVAILGERAQCDLAVNGRECFEAYQRSLTEKPYDVILLDISMPEVDGLTALKMIRKDEEARGVLVGKGVPIIMVTAFKHEFMNAFNGGCDDFIIKPVDAAKLIFKIEKKLSDKAI